MKNLLFTFFVIAVIIFSCKKKEDPTPPLNGTTTGGATTGSNTGPVITPTNVTSFHGILTTGNYSTYLTSMNMTFTSTGARAFFSNSAVSNISAFNSVKVNTVSINGDSLTFNSSYSYYLSTPGSALNLSLVSWSVFGSNGIPSFSCMNMDAVPVCSNLNSVPDSISKSAGFSITLNNVTNITSANVLLYNLSGGSGGSLSKPINAGNNTVSFNVTELSAISTGTNAAMVAVIMENSHAVNVLGKNFKFSKETQFTKYIKVNP